MAWEERTVKEMREEFVRRVLAKEKSKAALCREYGISRPTGDKWLQRFQEGQPLSDRSRAPQRQAGRVSPEMEASIVQLRQQYPALGAEKLRKIMENRGGENLPCARTFNNIFARNHLITKDASLAVTHIQRFEKEKPNDMWQTDFKGNFALANGVRCHPLNILDDRSRFCLCVEALENETFLAVKPVFERVFSEYGLPLACCATTGIHGAQHRARATLPLRCGLWSWASSPCMAALVIRRPKGNRSALTVLLPTSVWTEIRSWILRMLR